MEPVSWRPGFAPPATPLTRRLLVYFRSGAYNGNVLIENRNGLVVDTALVMASRTAERDDAVEMAQRIEGEKRVPVGAGNLVLLQPQSEPQA